jgi:hypothetical protein
MCKKDFAPYCASSFNMLPLSHGWGVNKTLAFAKKLIYGRG